MQILQNFYEQLFCRMKTTVSVIKIVLKQASKIMTDEYLDLNITEIILHSFSASSFFSSSIHFSLFVAFHLLLKCA